MSYKIEPVTSEDENLYFSVKSRLSNERRSTVTEEEKRIAYRVLEYWRMLDLDYILYKMGLDAYFSQKAFDHLYSEYYRKVCVNGLSQGSMQTIIADVIYNGNDDILKKCIPVEGF